MTNYPPIPTGVRWVDKVDMYSPTTSGVTPYVTVAQPFQPFQNIAYPYFSLTFGRPLPGILKKRAAGAKKLGILAILEKILIDFELSSTLPFIHT